MWRVILKASGLCLAIAMAPIIIGVGIFAWPIVLILATVLLPGCVVGAFFGAREERRKKKKEDE